MLSTILLLPGMLNRCCCRRFPVTTRILFVCLGNICRSPTAEGVCRHLALAEGVDAEFDSAGTGAWHVGSPPDDRAADAALRRGYDLSDLRARRVARRDFAEFDLILAMDRTNLEWLEANRPPGGRARLGLFLEEAGGTACGDVPDPYHAGKFAETLDMIESACRGLVASLRREN